MITTQALFYKQQDCTPLTLIVIDLEGTREDATELTTPVMSTNFLSPRQTGGNIGDHSPRMGGSQGSLHMNTSSSTSDAFQAGATRSGGLGDQVGVNSQGMPSDEESTTRNTFAFDEMNVHLDGYFELGRTMSTSPKELAL